MADKKWKTKSYAKVSWFHAPMKLWKCDDYFVRADGNNINSTNTKMGNENMNEENLPSYNEPRTRQKSKHKQLDGEDEWLTDIFVRLLLLCKYTEAILYHCSCPVVDFVMLISITTNRLFDCLLDNVGNFIHNKLVLWERRHCLVKISAILVSKFVRSTLKIVCNWISATT